MEKSLIPCPICGKKHNFYRVKKLAIQLSISADSLRRKLADIPHLSVGRARIIPECCLKELYKLHYPDDDLLSK